MHCPPLASLGHTLENPFDGAVWQLASLTLAVHYLARRLEQLSLPSWKCRLSSQGGYLTKIGFQDPI